MPPARWVICKLCGTQFDVNTRGGYYDGRRYICKRCAKLIKKQKISEGFTGEPGNDSYVNIYREKPKSWFSKNWKVVIGIFLLLGGIGNIGKDWDTVLFGVLLGSLLIFSNITQLLELKSKKKIVLRRSN